MSSGFFDIRMNKMIQQGVQGNIIHLLSVIWLEDKKHVDLLRIWRDEIELMS